MYNYFGSVPEDADPQHLTKPEQDPNPGQKGAGFKKKQLLNKTRKLRTKYSLICHNVDLLPCAGQVRESEGATAQAEGILGSRTPGVSEAGGSARTAYR